MFYTFADACAPFGFGFAESPLRSEASSAHSTAKTNQEFCESIAVRLREALAGTLVKAI